MVPDRDSCLRITSVTRPPLITSFFSFSCIQFSCITRHLLRNSSEPQKRDSAQCMSICELSTKELRISSLWPTSWTGFCIDSSLDALFRTTSVLRLADRKFTAFLCEHVGFGCDDSGTEADRVLFIKSVVEHLDVNSAALSCPILNLHL